TITARKRWRRASRTIDQVEADFPSRHCNRCRCTCPILMSGKWTVKGSFFAFPEIVFILDFDHPPPLSYAGAMRTRRVLSMFVTLLFAAHSAVAQESTARLLGTVKDQTGAVIPGAMVKATNVGTGLERMIRTNEGGDYSIPLLPIGEYTLSVEAAGFK